MSELSKHSERVGGLRRNNMSVAAIVFFVIAAVAPIGAIVGGSPVIFGAAGSGAPGIMLIVGILFGIFSVGYVTMSRHVSNAGGFVAYVAEGFGPRVAAAVAMTTVIGYLSLVTGFWGFTAGLIQYTFGEKFGVNIPPAVSLTVLVGLVTFLTYRGVNVSLKALGVLLVLEVAVILAVNLGVVGSGGAAGLSAHGFSWPEIAVPGFGIAFLFAVTNYTGIEATVVFSEEARDPKTSIPRAAYIAITVVAIFYAFTVWSISMGVGPAEVQAAANANPQGLVFETAYRYGGSFIGQAFEWLVFTSLLAMFIGFHNIVSRYIFAIARAGLFVEPLSRAHSDTGSPNVAALFMGACVLGLNLLFLLAGQDPMGVIYPWFTALGTVSIQIGLIVTSLSVIAFFDRTGVDRRVWHTKIAPALASIGFLAAGLLAVTNYDMLLGGQGGIARWMLLLLPFGALVGWVYSGQRIKAGKHMDFAASLN
jgi:amino acid transporter